ncbi:MAG: cyclic nucleotide-binding domain-containing protein [Nitrospinota bacterium]|nr:cyclic nucleotide-binding domain-containing protein [Nitrospinota bacterium]
MADRLEDKLKEYLEGRTKAKNPVNPEVFKFIPFFEEVFPKNLWPLLVNLCGNDGIPYIELKEIPPKQAIIKKGEFDMMVFWLLKGHTVVKGTVAGKQTVIKRYDRVGHCFGEMAIIDESERTADVTACAERGATILEVDWSITMVNEGLERSFNKLLLKTVNAKLSDSYNTIKKSYLALMKLREASEKQTKDLEKMKTKLEKHNIEVDTMFDMDLTAKISEIAAKLDEEMKRS